MSEATKKAAAPKIATFDDEDRLSGQVARLLDDRASRGRRTRANVLAREPVRVAAGPREDRQARRPRRLGHEPADGQRVSTTPAQERDHVPGRASFSRRSSTRRATTRSTTAAIGGVIGHEITHGFDNSGRKFDAKGNQVDWWTGQDAKKFDERAKCIIQQFDGYFVEPDVHQNGELVQGESIADLGGLTIAYRAYKKSLEGKPAPPPIDGLTGGPAVLRRRTPGSGRPTTGPSSRV